MTSKSGKKLIFQSICQKTNGNTGEIMEETTTNVISIRQEPEFVKVYLQDITRILALPPTCKDIAYALLQIMGYDGLIRLTMATKLRISEQLGIKEKVFKNYLTALVKQGVLRRVATSEYEMNPHLFAKGHWKDISKRREEFELTIKYNSQGERELKGKFII